MIRRFKQVIKALRCLSHPIARRALARGIAAGVEHLPILRSLSFSGPIFDIGANRGQFSLVARICFPDKRIFAFEPYASAADSYRCVFGADRNVELFCTAVSSVDSERILHVSQRDDSSSLLPIGDLQNDTYPGTSLKKQVRVRSCPISASVNFADVGNELLLKIDVQGSELDVLKSTEANLTQFKYIYVECSMAEFYVGQPLACEVMEFLSLKGFRLEGAYNPSVSSDGVRLLQADFLFKRITV